MSWSCDRCGLDRQEDHATCRLQDAVETAANAIAERLDKIVSALEGGAREAPPGIPVAAVVNATTVDAVCRLGTVTSECVCSEGEAYIRAGAACWPGYAASNTGPCLQLAQEDQHDTAPALIAFCPWCGRRPKP